MMEQEERHSPDSERAWGLLVARIEAVERAVDRAAERDDEAWSEYRAKCQAEDKTKAAMMADTAAMVERGRVETMHIVETRRVETAASVEHIRVLLANEVERLRVEIAAAVEENRKRLADSIDKRIKAIWVELRRRPNASHPPFWHNVDARLLIICGLIALALLAVIFNARNLGELFGTLIAKLAGK
jgi:hypothetical protein